MLKKLLYLYNDGHIPFPQGKGGLGYHLPQYRKRMYGDGLKFDKDGNLLFVPDANMTSEQAVYANTQLWEAEHQLPPLKNIPDEEDETGIKFIEDEEIDAKNKAEVDKIYLINELLNQGATEKQIHDTFYTKVDNEKVRKNEEKFLKDVLEKADEYQEEQIQELRQDIKNISRKKSIGYGIAFEDYLVNPENVHVLKDELKFTSSLSSDHPILDTQIIVGGQPKQLKDVIVYDLFSQDCVYEIKNFGMSTRDFPAQSYDEIKSSNSPFIDIQCSKIEGNLSFKPTYVLYNDESFKITIPYYTASQPAQRNCGAAYKANRKQNKNNTRQSSLKRSNVLSPPLDNSEKKGRTAACVLSPGTVAQAVSAVAGSSGYLGVD